MIGLMPQTNVDEVLAKIARFEQFGENDSHVVFEKKSLQKEIQNDIKKLKEVSISDGYMIDMIFNGIQKNEAKCRSYYDLAKQQGAYSRQLDWNFALSLGYLGYESEASDIFLDLVDRDLGEPEIYRGASTHFSDMGYFDKAVQVLEKGLKLKDCLITERLIVCEKLANFVDQLNIPKNELNRYMSTVQEFQQKKGLYFKDRRYDFFDDGHETIACIEINTGKSIDDVNRLNDELFDLLASKDFTADIALNFVTMFR